MLHEDVVAFIKESNKIEGIVRDPTDEETNEFYRFIDLEKCPTISDLVQFVSVYQPNARMRNAQGLNVSVGRHFPPLGGPDIPVQLRIILDNMVLRTPYETHVAYETLHPFTDGNGRSGRMLWAWNVNREDWTEAWMQRGFLHSFYYQALEGARP